MNIRKSSLLVMSFLMGGCCAEEYRVGDVIEIPVGPSYDSCFYEVANAREVYFALDPAASTTILAPIEFKYNYNMSPRGEHLLIHRVRAIRPGKTTIYYNRVPVLGDCGCHDAAEYLGTYRTRNNEGEMVELPVMDDSMIASCKEKCEGEVFKQTLKHYKSVTITVLPVE